MLVRIIAPIFVFGISILVHELGHFLAARRAGIDVEKFSFGFGPKLVGIKRGQTEYCICLLFFFGGYVKMAGDEMGEEPKGERTGREFLSKPPSKRSLVVLAGPLMNLLLAVIVYTAVFRIGMPEPVTPDGLRIAEVKEGSPWARAGLQGGDRITALEGKAVETWNRFFKIIVLNPNKPLELELNRGGKRIITSVNPERDEGGLPIIDDILPSQSAILGQVHSGYPAEAAGLCSGDEILAIDGREINSWNEMSKIIRAKPGEETELLVKRDNEQIKVKVTPVLDKEKGFAVIGVTCGTRFEIRRYGLVQSFGKSLIQSKEDICMLFKFLKLLICRQISPKNIAGPIGIIHISGQVAQAGFIPLLLLIALININFGIINLFPIPIVDGGHIVLFSIEAIRRKPLSEKKLVVIQKIGIAFLITMLVLISYNDILRLAGELLGR
ncbi:RIP metalloprotease RseP [bacterium]|nr:RIP metalloprotease RseP [bacterium]